MLHKFLEVWKGFLTLAHAQINSLVKSVILLSQHGNPDYALGVAEAVGIEFRGEETVAA